MNDTPNNITELVLARKEQEEQELHLGAAVAEAVFPGLAAPVAPANLTLVPTPRVDGSFISRIILNDYRAGLLVEGPQPELHWTFTDTFLKGTVGFIVAPPGTGKSTLTAELAASTVMGMGIFGYNLSPGKAGKVLAIFCEENKSILQSRVYNIYNNLFSVGNYENITGQEIRYDVRFKENMFLIPAAGQNVRLVEASSTGLNASKAFKELLALAKSIDGLELIILDPLSRLFGQNENDNSAATFFCSLLEQLAEETGASVLCVHHTGKGSSSGKGAFKLENVLTQDAIRGASAFTGAVRWQLNLVSLPGKFAEDEFNLGYTPKDDEYIALRVVKTNHGSPGSIFYMKRGEGGFLSNYIPEPDTREYDAKASLVDKLIQYVKTLEDSGDELLTKSDIKRVVAPLWKKEEVANATQKGIEEAALKAIEDGLLFWVTRAIKDSNRTAQYLSTKPG